MGIPLAITVAATVAVNYAASALAPRPKLNPVDRGRFDDIRLQTAEEGGFKPLCFGKRVRLAANMIWGTPTQEYITRDPGRTGGKGGSPEPPTPPTNTFSYKKSFAFLVCATPVKSYRRINENLEVIYNNVGSELFEGFSEVENGTPSGGALVVTDTELSAGRGVRLAGTGHFVNVGCSALSASLHTVSIFYKAASPAQVYASANGGTETLVALPATGSTPSSVTATLLLKRGLNSLKFRGGAGTSDLDKIFVSDTGDPPEPKFRDPTPTFLIDPDAAFPSDPDNPTPYYNQAQVFDANGYFEGFLTAGGQARFELFAGKETQPQSAIIVAREGASETPAWRDDSYFVTEDYLVRDGQLGNFIFEIEPEIQRLDLILEYLYTLDERAAASECDFSALSDITPDGLVLDHRAPLEEWVKALEGWFNFDIVPRGGKVTAVKRGGAVVTRLYERELRAHLYGQERPRAAVKITHEDPTDLPGSADVIYLDPAPSKDFHTGNQTTQKQIGHSFDPETLSFPIVGDADTAQAVGQRYLDGRHLAAKPGSFVCGFGKRHLIPTDVVEVETESGTLHTYRIVQKQADLLSLVSFRAVPERASIYAQEGAGVRGRGGDVLVIGPPANTLVVVADSVPVRQADAGRLVLIAAACPRGQGSWPGYHLNKRDQNGELERVGGFQAAATVGVVEAVSQSAARFGFEPAREFVVKLYHGSLESRTESEVRAERLNLALYGKGSVWEVLQFLSVEAQTPTAPFVAQYKVTGTVSGLYGTEWASNVHQAGDYFVLVDAAVESFPMRPADVTLPFEFVAQTVGQAAADAEAAGTTSLTFQGNSMKPLAVARVLLDETTGLTPRDSTGAILTTVEPRTNVETIGDEYLIQYLTDDRAQVLHEQEFGEGLPTPAVLQAEVIGAYGKYSSISGGNTFSLSGALASGRAFALQRIAGFGAFVESELRAVGATITLGLISAGKDWRTAAPDFSIVLSGEGIAALECYEGSTLLYSDPSPTAYTSGGTRFRLETAGRRIRFFKDKTSDGTQFMAESAAAPDYPLVAVVLIETGSSGSARAKEVILSTSAMPTTVLTAAQQQLFYGGLKAPAQVRILQHSGVREVGYGFPWNGAI
jgi:hypothetical protein